MPADPEHCRALAQILCEATEAVLWQHVQPWLAQRPGSHHLHCRVGRGEATYYSAREEGQHLLTYGWKMVASKYDAGLARQWRTGAELLQRRYFEGEMTVANVLAHTCCHEFGHVIQGINGWISHGSIHNADFYRIVDRIHHSGAALRVRNHLVEASLAQGIGLEFLSSESAPQGDTAAFRPGELVSFEYRGRPVLGEVLRVNRKTVNVKPVMPRLAADYFRISPHFLTHHEQGQP